MTVFTGYVLVVGQIGEKSLRFQIKTHTCGRGLGFLYVCPSAPPLNFSALFNIYTFFCSLEQLPLFHSIWWQFHSSNFDKFLDTAPFNVNFHFLRDPLSLEVWLDSFFFLLVLVCHKFIREYSTWLYVHLLLLSLAPAIFTTDNFTIEIN